MKRLIFFISIITLMCSCGKEKDIVPDYTLPPSELEKKVKEYIKDTSEFEQGTIWFKEIGGQILFIGVRNKKVWVGEYDSQSKKEIQTWIGELPIKEKINKLMLLSCVKNESDFALRVLINPSEDKNIANIGVMILNNKKSNIIYYGYSEQLVKNGLFIHNIYSFSSGFLAAIHNDEISGGNVGKDLPYYIFLSLEGKQICKIQHNQVKDGCVMSGFTDDNKIWIGLCDKVFPPNNSSGAEPIIELKEEWIGNDAIERNIDYYLGYGNSEKVYISSVSIKEVISTSCGYLVNLKSGYNHPISTFDGYYCLYKGKINRVSEVGKGMREWYKGSVLVVSLTNSAAIYSQDGTKIMDVKNIYDVDKNAISTSYDSYILYSQSNGDLRVKGYTLSDNTKVTFDSPIKKVASDAKITRNLLESETDIWKYQIDVLNYDGSKETIKYTLDVKTGKVVLI